MRKKAPNQSVFTNYELRRAIMMECGTDPKTYANNRKALIILGWIKTHKKQYVELTDDDLG